jgi:iron(III) transport system substrate-binding protein
MHTRRSGQPWGIVVAVALCVVACAPAAPVPTAAPASQPAVAVGASTATQPGGPASAKDDSQVAWEQALAAARQEGSLVLALQPGDVWRQWVERFEQTYPGIKLEATSITGADFVPRVLPERRADQYLWDVYIGGPESPYRGLKPAGALAPLKPAVLLPEVLDDSKWVGGFDGGFNDVEGMYVYSYRGELTRTVVVNRDLVPAAELSRVEDLVEPRWRGKLSTHDPRPSGKGASDGGHFVMIKGEDWYRQLLAQEPVPTSDRRQQIEWLVRGRYPIAISADTTYQTEFRQQGLGLNTAPLAPESEMGSRVALTSTIALLDRAPHSNAAKVFVTWALSRPGQEAFSQITVQNSRRVDVSGPPESALDPRVQYPPPINAEQYNHFQARAQEIAREVLR